MAHWRPRGGIAPIVLALATAATAALATDDFPITGTYMQDRPCPPGGPGASRWRVVITSETIVYATGTCTVSNSRRNGNAFVVRAQCEHKSGKTLASDVTFTLRDDRSLEMKDEYATYRAVLNRCGDAAQGTRSQGAAGQ